MNTAQTVQDIDLIRQLLGYDKIDFVGYSGGTWMGAYYQTYFPEHVGRFVLDSNTDFTRAWLDTFVAPAAGVRAPLPRGLRDLGGEVRRPTGTRAVATAW